MSSSKYCVWLTLRSGFNIKIQDGVNNTIASRSLIHWFYKCSTHQIDDQGRGEDGDPSNYLSQRHTLIKVMMIFSLLEQHWVTHLAPDDGGEYLWAVLETDVVSPGHHHATCTHICNSCYVMSWYVTICYVMLRCVMSCCVMLWAVRADFLYVFRKSGRLHARKLWFLYILFGWRNDSTKFR